MARPFKPRNEFKKEKVEFKKPINKNIPAVVEQKPKLPYLGKRVKKLNIFVEGQKYECLVQANKNHGICNIVAIDRVSNKLNKLGEALTFFQGRQYDHPDTMYQLENFIINHIIMK